MSRTNICQSSLGIAVIDAFLDFNCYAFHCPQNLLTKSSALQHAHVIASYCCFYTSQSMKSSKEDVEQPTMLCWVKTGLNGRAKSNHYTPEMAHALCLSWQNIMSADKHSHRGWDTPACVEWRVSKRFEKVSEGH